jgi:hypothetical protein
MSNNKMEIAPARTEVWVCLVGGITSDRATAIECNPEVTSFDKLMKLVKAEFKPDLDHVSAPRLMIRKNARDYWKNSARVSNATDCEDLQDRRGDDEDRPLEVEVPVLTSGPSGG